MSQIAIPGQVVGTISTHIAGPGTHVHQQNILASIVGPAVTIPAQSKSGKPTVSIQKEATLSTSVSTLRNTSTALPAVGSTVLCRVTRVQQRQLNAAILLIYPAAQPQTSSPTSIAATNNTSPTSAQSAPHQIIAYPTHLTDDVQFSAILRREDIRAYEKDKIVMNDSFRVGDIVKATVISLGDERSYYVSTAGNELGVVVARSEAGNAMVPASWKEMRDVVTGKGEGRKVAKPV